jgi:hypothetical protein
MMHKEAGVLQSVDPGFPDLFKEFPERSAMFALKTGYESFYISLDRNFAESDFNTTD